MAILNRFSAILQNCDLTRFLACRCEISGDSRPAIMEIVRFAIRDSVPLTKISGAMASLATSSDHGSNFFSRQARNKELKDKLLGPDIFRWGGGLPRE